MTILCLTFSGQLACQKKDQSAVKSKPAGDVVGQAEGIERVPREEGKSKSHTPETEKVDRSALIAVPRVVRKSDRPNIILINLDDADYEMLSPETMSVYFPNLKRFADQGIRFTNFHVTTPLCGPSRAALFRGQYAFRTNIRSNDPFAERSNGFEGGMRMYGRQGFHENDLSVWMKAAGYRTMMIGKYLHGDLVNKVPDGWDDFYSSRGANYFATSRFTNKDVAGGQHHHEGEANYRTTQEGMEALALIDQQAARNADSENPQPFFMYLAPLAPHHHTPHDPRGMVEAKYKSLWPETRMPLHPDYMEADFSDKSTAIRDVAMMTDRQQERLASSYRDRMLSMKSVDDMVGSLLAKLETQGLIDNSYVVLTSDNGFSNGHHRMIGKGDSFDRSSRVPTYVIGPGIAGGRTANHLLAHIDLAPTIVDLGGGNCPDLVDGKSFKPLLLRGLDQEEDAVGHAEEWRDAILIENFESRSLQGSTFNTASLALRMYDSVYVEWANGSPEYYDLGADPWQVENQIETLSDDRRHQLAADLRKLRNGPADPLTTISQPFALHFIHSRGQPMAGMAEANSGVDRVEISIRRISDSQFWNGQSWQTSPTINSAALTNPGQMMTTWSFNEMPDQQPPDEMIEVQAWAIGNDQTVDPDPELVVFRFDYTRPQSIIEYPTEPDGLLERFHLKGTTFDEGGVDHVQVVIRNRATGEYWNGSAWSPAWVTIELPVRPNGRFGVVYDQLFGNYYVSVRAVDVSGNVQSPPTKAMVNVTWPQE